MKQILQNPRVTKLALISCLTVLCAGCSLNWYDERSGTQHLVGFGYFKMRAIPQATNSNDVTAETIAYVTGVRNIGLQVGGGGDFLGLSAGWDSRSRVIIKSESSSFSLIWPTNSTWLPFSLNNLFNVCIGTNFPFISSNK